MDDSEFDKRYADKIRRAGAPDLSDDDWERLTPKLDAVQRRRWRVLPLWWLGALTGLLLCSNISWWWMWHQSEKSNDAIRTEWQQIRRETVALRDTTWSKVVVYQYDTVYRTVFYRTISERSTASNGTNLVQENAKRSTAAITDASQKSSILPSTPEAQSLPNPDEQTVHQDKIGQNQPITKSIQNLDLLPIKTVFLELPTRRLKLSENDFVLVLLKKAHTPRQPLLIPRKFRLGAGGGLVIPKAESLYNKLGYLLSLNSEIAFSERLALTLEGAYYGLNFMGNMYDESLGLPPEQYPGDDFVLKYFKPEEEGLKPVLQLTAGMRYWIRSDHRVSPYLGLGYAMQWHLPYELQLEYINTITGQDKEQSIEVPALDRPVSLLNFNAGVRYRFWRQLSLQTGAFYQFKIDANQPGIPYFWGINSAVMYEF